MTSPLCQHLESATFGEILHAVCDECGDRSDLIRLPAPVRTVVELIQGFERTHAGCGEKGRDG